MLLEKTQKTQLPKGSPWNGHLSYAWRLHHASSSFAIYGQNRPEQGREF